MSKLLLYLEQNVKASRRTKIWRLVSLAGEIELGSISWYAGWRRFVFRPSVRTLFDAECLEEIALFCAEQTQIRKLERKKEKGE